MPKPVEATDPDDFYADSDGDGGASSDSHDSHAGHRHLGPSHHLHRAARAAAVPTECHALGSLSNMSYALIKPGRPELGVALTYRGGDACMKRVVTGGGEKLGAGRVGSVLPAVAWVPTPRQLTLRLRCDRSDDAVEEGGPAGLAAAMQLARRVRVVETEMCEYVVEWPTRHGCPAPPRALPLRAAAALARPAAALPALAVLGCAAALVAQMARQQARLRVLWRGLKRFDAAAWQQLPSVLLSKARAAPPRREGLALTRRAARPARCAGGVHRARRAPPVRRPRDLSGALARCRRHTALRARVIRSTSCVGRLAQPHRPP